MSEDIEYNIENIKSQMKKGTLEFCILLIISKGKTYSGDILKELKKYNLIVVEGTIYPLLSRLKNSGLLDYTWEESKSGPPRKYFSITKNGEDFLIKIKDNWDNLNKSISLLIKKYE